MNFLSTGVGRFIVKRIGSKIGGSMFNSGVSSCDGYDQNCGPCCFSRKEAEQRGMSICGTNICKPTTNLQPKNIGGINICQIINLTGQLDKMPIIIIDANTQRIILRCPDGSPFVNEFDSFNLDYFYTALLLTLGDNNLELTISLNPIDKYQMKCTSKPDFIIKERYVNDILFLCDWILKCLVFGSFINDTTGESIPFDEPICKKLNSIGYKSALQLREESSANFSAYSGTTWIEPEYINVGINNNKLFPLIGLTCFAKVDSKDDTWTGQFANWFTNHFDEITEIFPIYNELRELIVTLATVKILRHFEMDLYKYEDLAVKYLQMGKFMVHKFVDEIYKYHVFELGKQQFISGGIVNNFSINSLAIDEKIIHIITSTNNPISVENNAPIILTVLSELRLKLGSYIKINKNQKVKDIIIKFAMMSKIDPNWIEFYDANNVKLKNDDNISCDVLYIKLNIKNTSETLTRMMICDGRIIV